MFKVEVEVNEAAYNFSKGVSTFLVAMKKEIDDGNGWEVGDDLPGIISAAVTDLVPVLSDVLNLGEEYGKDKAAFTKAMLIGLSELVSILGDKEEGEDTLA